MAKVSLINLNRVIVPPIAPYAIDILGSALEAAGHSVEVLDLTPQENPAEAIDEYFSHVRPDLVGITLRNTGDLYFPSFLDLPDKGSFLPEHGKLIARIKEHAPINRVIIGGVGFSSNPFGLLKRFGLRYGVVGPGDSVFVEIANAVSHGLSLGEICPNSEGIFDGRGSRLAGKIKRKFVDNKWYYGSGGLGSIRTTNGCGMACSYCIEPLAKGNCYTKNFVDDVIYEINQLVDMGINDIHTCDSEFNMPLHHSKDVLRAIIRQKYADDVRFWAYCQPKPFDGEYAYLLAKSNVTGVNFGIDHADPEMLHSLGKWYTQENILNSTKLCHKYGIAVNHELLFGYPGDTPEKMFRAIDFVTKLDAWAMGVVVGLAVLPGTRLACVYQNKVKSGKSLDGFYVSGEPLTDPAFFADPSFEIPEVFNQIRDYVGSDIKRIMVPQSNSTASENNQLVCSERIKKDLRKGKRGAYWYHYPSSRAAISPQQELLLESTI